MFFTVYILYSQTYSKHYTGFTTDLVQRLLSHNELGKELTANYRPWKVIYTKEFQTKKDALKFKNGLKSDVRIDYLSNSLEWRLN